jgi:hypothetical protein
MRTLIVMSIIAIIASGAGRVLAQPDDKPMKKIEQFKKMKLLDVLDLDEASANKFLVKYDKWSKDIVALTKDRNSLAIDLKLTIDKKGSDADINALLDKLVDVSGRLDAMKHDMFVDLRTILTPVQAAKLAFFEGQFKKKLEESLNKLRGDGRPGGPGPRWR